MADFPNRLACTRREAGSVTPLVPGEAGVCETCWASGHLPAGSFCIAAAGVSLNDAFEVTRRLPPAALVGALRGGVAYYHGRGFGVEAGAVWEACVGGYRTAGRPFGLSDAGLGRWLLGQEVSTFAAAGSARLVADYLLNAPAISRSA